METILKTLNPSIADILDRSVAKVLDFLVENRSFDYSKEEVAEGSGVSRPTLYRIWPTLERNGLIEETRKYGNTKLYKINGNSELVKFLIKIEIQLVKEQFKRMDKRNK
ncbi:MAG: winged helix-turn-helix transcriptional regulator [Candidatus Aenigmarchaeota archaeon]|nr:winged helix-turn-helix transcriptional regulator [Candidatus Aenigmarchaeota archaeon]